MCYEPRGLWIVELTKQDKVKTTTLDADTKITNICLNHEPLSRAEGSQSSIKLTSNGHAGTICTLTPGKVEQALMDILLPKGAKILLELVGDSAVFVTGYHVQSVCVRTGNIKPAQHSTDSTASRRSTETTTPPNAPLKRTSGFFSDSDPRPATDRRRAGPVQIPTLPVSSKMKMSTPFTFNVPLKSVAPMSFTFPPASWPTGPIIIHADPSPANPLPVPHQPAPHNNRYTDPVRPSAVITGPRPLNLDSILPLSTSLKEEQDLAIDGNSPTISSAPTNFTAAVDPQPINPDPVPHSRLPSRTSAPVNAAMAVAPQLGNTSPEQLSCTMPRDEGNVAPDLITTSSTLIVTSLDSHRTLPGSFPCSSPTPPPTPPGDGTDGPPNSSIATTPDHLTPSNDSDQLPQIPNGSAAPTAVSPFIIGKVDIKVGTGTLVSEETWLSFRTVFRINGGLVFDCFSFHGISCYLRDCHRLAPGLIEGLSGMRGGGIRKVSFHSDTIHSSWKRRETRGLLVGHKTLTLEIRLFKVEKIPMDDTVSVQHNSSDGCGLVSK